MRHGVTLHEENSAIAIDKEIKKKAWISENYRDNRYISPFNIYLGGRVNEINEN